MSSLSEQVRVALYAKLNVQSVTDLAEVYHDKADSSAAFPFLIFRRAASRNEFSFGITVAMEDDLWLIKAVTDADTSGIYSPQGLGELITQAAESAIGNSLTLSSGTARAVYRLNDIPQYSETLNDREIYHTGFNLRVASNG